MTNNKQQNILILGTGPSGTKIATSIAKRIENQIVILDTNISHETRNIHTPQEPKPISLSNFNFPMPEEATTIPKPNYGWYNQLSKKKKNSHLKKK